MAKIEKIKKGTATIYPATIPQAVVDPTSGKSAREELDEKAKHGYDSAPKTLKAVDEAKVDKTSIVGETGQGETSVMSQKAVTDEIAQLAGEVSVKMTNLLQNSSFENGVTNPIIILDAFGSESTITINTINPISGNYDARLEVTTPGANYNRPYLRLNGNQGGWVLDHIFYFGMSVKVNSGTPVIYQVHNGTNIEAIYLTLKDGFNSWTVECIGLNSFGYIFLDGRTLWDFNFDNLIAYDLTAIFGEGNEPTKEEMDLLISTLGINYFEGEITIPAQKVMQWQLALIRKNKNAIIALGGTII